MKPRRLPRCSSWRQITNVFKAKRASSCPCLRSLHVTSQLADKRFSLFWIAVNAGETFKVRVDNLTHEIKGPATVKMISRDVPYQLLSCESTTSPNETFEESAGSNGRAAICANQIYDGQQYQTFFAPACGEIYGSEMYYPNALMTCDAFPIFQDENTVAATRAALVQYLSQILPPQVLAVNSKSVKILIDNSPAAALITSGQFVCLHSLKLKCKGKINDEEESNEADFREVYRGVATEISIIDLKPAHTYSIKCSIGVSSVLMQLFGHDSSITTFKTSADVPLPPEEVQLHFNDHNIRATWSACEDNGSPIIFYDVELSEHNDHNFNWSYRTSKPCIKFNLLPSCTLALRVVAVNAIGRSKPSEPVSFAVPRRRRMPNRQQRWSRSSSANSSSMGTSSPSFKQINDSGIRTCSDEEMIWNKVAKDSVICYNGELGWSSGNSSSEASSWPLSKQEWQKIGDESNEKSNEENEYDTLERKSWLLPVDYSKHGVAKDDPHTNDSGNSSIRSNSLEGNNSKSPPPINISLSAESVEGRQIRLKWTLIPSYCCATDNQIFLLEFCVDDDEFVELYKGVKKQFQHRNLKPNCNYCYRIQHLCANSSDHCENRYERITIKTPIVGPLEPKFVTSDCYSDSANSICLSWIAPVCDGGNPITAYMVYLDDALVAETQTPSCRLEGLQSRKTYEIRCRAINQAGLLGSMSDAICLTTLGPSPDPPEPLQLISASWNFLKLRWNPCGGGEQTNKRLKACYDASYTIEMVTKGLVDRGKVVYSGTKCSAKIGKLREATTYTFRICSKCIDGTSRWSRLYEFSTTYTPPNPPSGGPKIKQVDSNSCLVSWAPVKTQKSQCASYVLEMRACNSEQFFEIYCGVKSFYRIENLKVDTDYEVRVWSKRVLPDRSTIISSRPSDVSHFRTKKLNVHEARHDMVNTCHLGSKFFSMPSSIYQIFSSLSNHFSQKMKDRLPLYILFTCLIAGIVAILHVFSNS